MGVSKVSTNPLVIKTLEKVDSMTPEDFFSETSPDFHGIIQTFGILMLSSSLSSFLSATACNFGMLIAGLEHQQPNQPLTFEDHLHVFCHIARKFYVAEKETLADPNTPKILQAIQNGTYNLTGTERKM